jgi:hypothetical protein
MNNDLSGSIISGEFRHYLSNCTASEMLCSMAFFIEFFCYCYALRQRNQEVQRH